MRQLLQYKDFLFYVGLPVFALIIVIVWLLIRLILLRNEMKALQNMLISLLSKYSNRDYILSNYEYDVKLGVYRHKFSDRYYCHKCFIDDTKESPLEPPAGGLYCPVCGSLYKTSSGKFSPNA